LPPPPAGAAQAATLVFTWAISEKYDIDTKPDSAAVEELKKLNPDQRRIAHQHLLQTLLAERFKLTLHGEAKELPIYSLGIADGGPFRKHSLVKPPLPDSKARTEEEEA
jgi:uncharacterized protein (TIGR03435 family)